MDPISAFQLAAAVIGVVDFGARVLSETREIYHSASGRTARDVELSTLAQELSGLGAQLQSRIPHSSTPLVGAEATLVDLSQRCMDASDRLNKAISDLRCNTSGTGRISTAAGSFASALKTVWKGSEIESLRESLAEIRSQMTLAILVCVLSRQETRKDDQRHTDLGGRLDQIAQKLDHRDGPAHQFARELIQVMSQERMTQVSQRNEHLIQILWSIDWNSWVGSRNGEPVVNFPQPANPLPAGDLPIDMKILSSLSFAEINAREEAISEAHAATFQWLFGDQETDENGDSISWPSFPLWLRETAGSLYWITGKPGSGKSTLMKFIFENPQLRSCLGDYAGDLPLLLAGFFFWNPGTGMQKSREGLLRTLLYECLMARRDLIPTVAPRRWALYNLLGGDARAPEWTWRELTETFETLCAYHGKLFRLAVFIDGLDEFDGAEKFPEVLLGWTRDIVQRHGIKVCVSSRPWNTFTDAFRHDRSLSMQDLSRRDIRRFVHAEFDHNPAFTVLREVFPAEADKLLKDIVEKAEGVFLWVSLVVRSLLSTLIDTPSIPHLQKVLAETPGDIMGLYDSIWKSIPPDKRTSASNIFQLFEAQWSGSDPPMDSWFLSAVIFWLAYEGPAVRASTVLDDAKREGIPKLLKRLLDGHTRGLLEVASGQVVALHRSVADWMKDEKTWAEIRQQISVDFNPGLELLEAILVDAPFNRKMKHPREPDIIAFCEGMFRQARLACVGPNINEHRLIQTLDSINKFISDKAAESHRNGMLEPEITFRSNDPNWDQFSSCGWPTILFLSRLRNPPEVCFSGLAAASGIVPYVKAKVKAYPDLLVPKQDRESLLESAIFPVKREYTDNFITGYIYFPPLVDSKDQRLEIIRFLLDTSVVRYKTSAGKSLYGAVSHVRSHCKGDLSMDDALWYTKVIQMMEEHGQDYARRPPCQKVQGEEKFRNIQAD
ncbi:hypothetical protein MFIFM68171_06557 [Madurella fahalii]|uniref:Nephrocystin 3-like N-terminal domain-containing protein n=1 Tax=Madurella fahalii TaxID=1157608 RepID=A0ABQ0GF42_9PEZI